MATLNQLVQLFSAKQTTIGFAVSAPKLIVPFNPSRYLLLITCTVGKTLTLSYGDTVDLTATFQYNGNLAPLIFQFKDHALLASGPWWAIAEAVPCTATIIEAFYLGDT